jgi:23S rRNA pseudouridine2605 synthase
MVEHTRLSKYLAACGVASRRESKGIIQSGRVKVNGSTMVEPGHKIAVGEDQVEVDGKAVAPKELQYAVFHKPLGCVCTRSDPQERKTIYDFLPPELHYLNYVGRLDYNTTGVLMLTNDGDLAYRLTRPEYKVPKEYVATVYGRATEQMLGRLTKGIKDDDQLLRAEQATLLKNLQSTAEVKIVLTEGKNREIRRMLEAIGLPVIALKRVRFAGLTVEGLEPEEWRLTDPVEADVAGEDQR